MKTLTYLAMALIILLANAVHAQEISGVATYKTQRKLDLKLDSTQVDSQMQEQIMAMMRKQFEKEYTLDFTQDESVYKVVESLDTPTAMGGGGFNVVVAGTGSSDVLYKNLKDNRYANKTDIFGKPFLVKDAIEQPEWTLVKETKNIGQYTCFKATMTRTITVSSSMSTEGTENDGSDSETQEEEQTVTAWYTPQIPIKNGPRNYGGLPGLILEVSDGSETILCSKIVLNPTKGVNIDEPSGGKEVDSETFQEIMEKKMQEMNERYQGSDRRGGGNHMQIRIGG